MFLVLSASIFNWAAQSPKKTRTTTKDATKDTDVILRMVIDTLVDLLIRHGTSNKMTRGKCLI